MPNIDSPYWDWNLGVCTKHYLPQVPCPSCIAEKDKDIEFCLTDLERSGWVSDDDIKDCIPPGFEHHRIF